MSVPPRVFRELDRDAKLVAQLGGEHALGQLLPDLPGQAGFAQDRFGILILDLGQQLIDQFIREQLRGL